MTNNTAVSKIVILVIGFFVAIIMANLLVTDKLMAFAWLGGAALLIFCLSLGKSIWLVIPIGAALGLTLMIPGRPTSLLLAHLMFIPFCVLLTLMRRIPFQFRFTELDFWLLALGLCILQVYIRNPVGVNLFGGENVGGRPYILVAVAFFSYFFVSNLTVKPEKLQWIVRLSIIGGCISFLFSLVGAIFPGVGAYLGKSGASAGEDGGMAEVGGVETTGAGQATRIGFLGSFARGLSLWISSYKNPLTACFHPVWGLSILATLAFAALSGFRNQIAAVGLTYIIGIFYRGGFANLVAAGVALLMGVGTLATVNLIMPLPANIQRSLSFLPGTWDEAIIRDAEGSTDWRVEIWEEVILTDRWIANKWIGDGLGFSAQELQAQASLREGSTSISGLGTHRDSILATGDYHSGPIQTIRTIGYVGLLFVLIAQIRLAVHAHRLIIQYRSTEWFPLVLIVGIPLVWTPLFFVAIFGTFLSAMEGLLLGAGFVKLMQRNLPVAAPIGVPALPTTAPSSRGHRMVRA